MTAEISSRLRAELLPHGTVNIIQTALTEEDSKVIVHKDDVSKLIIALEAFERKLNE